MGNRIKGLTEEQYNAALKVINILTSKFSNMSAVDVEIVVFNVLPYVIDNYDETKSKFESFLHQKAFWSLRTEFNRKKQRDLSIKGDLVLGDDESIDTIDEELARHDFYSEVQSVIMEMDIIEQNVLYLYLLGNNTSNIVDLLSVSRRRVDKLKAHVFGKLKDKLSHYEVY